MAAGRVTRRWKSLGENPEAIPRIVPDGEEAGRDKLAKVRREPGLLQPVNDEVIHHEIDQRDKNKASGNLAEMTFEPRVLKDPVTLQDEINRPAKNVGAELGPPQAPVQARPEISKQRIAGPKIGSAAN